MRRTDLVRSLAVGQLRRAQELLPLSVSPQEAVVRAYNERLLVVEDEPGVLHPDADDWILAHHAALGAMHEPLLDPRLSAVDVLEMAVVVLEMLIATPKALVADAL